MYFWSVIPNLHKMNREYITRDIQDLLIEASQYFSVICITGPRQSGKSTILKKMFPQAHIVFVEVCHLRDRENCFG